ncbi:apolipoprotein N-acyltransferase [Christensenella tenuis]|uniref:Apolipoprotein N-acyltransferase n=1 Tax=Christensenella tenuis TaxID=2763033 RepID=A0ABR7ED20_9FIRM|nr:apolipoprotein N-acyltransferase [Christensenella tenuis]MBC5647641.1 apolipoprotein N-acyltransferase [Christensenella tenuis]
MKHRRWIERVICAACGIFCALCFDVAGLAPFVWAALAPVFFLLLKNSGERRRVVFCACIFALAFTLAYYAQILSLDISARAGEASAALLVAAWIGLAALHGAVFAAALSAGVLLKCPCGMRALLCAVLFTGAEWLLGVGALGLPFLRLGLTQWRFLPLTQSAQMFGVLFISFLIVLVNVLIAQAVLGTGRGRMRYLAAAALVFFANLAGGILVSGGRAEEADTGIAAVQMNVPFWQNEGEGRFEKALALAEKEAGKRPDFILLPENSVYGSFNEEPEISSPVAKLAKESGAYVLTGVYGVHGYQLRNSVFLTAPDGKITDVYHKQRLVPFFENGYERKFSFTDGKERGIFETDCGMVGVMICFESLFPDIASETAAGGAELLVVATNDSWFKSDVPLARHLAQSVFRAQETGRWLVQVGNTGMTAIVSPTGEIAASLEAGTDGVLVGNVAFRREKTGYLILGDWWLAAAAAAAVLGLAAAYKKRI